MQHARAPRGVPGIEHDVEVVRQRTAVPEPRQRIGERLDAALAISEEAFRLAHFTGDRADSAGWRLGPEELATELHGGGRSVVDAARVVADDGPEDRGGR